MSYTITPNVAALLATIRHSEGADKAPNPYRCVFGYGTTLINLADHPVITGEWLGAHWNGGFSTAAGAYQINHTTWLGCRKFIDLPDFTGPSQDQAACLLIDQKGGIQAINGGNFIDAVNLCRGIWASLPESTVDQPHANLAALTQFYVQSGGAFA